MRGERLTLAPLVGAHADTLFPLLADDELWKFTGENAPASLEALRDRYRRLESRRSPDRTQLWLNWALESHEHGIAGLVQATVSVDRQEAAVAYVIARRFWARGLGTEAVAMLLTFLRDELHVVRAVATVDARNGASLRLLGRLGFAIAHDDDDRNLRLELQFAEL